MGRNRVIDKMVLIRARGMERTSGTIPSGVCERYTTRTLPTFIAGFRPLQVRLRGVSSGSPQGMDGLDGMEAKAMYRRTQGGGWMG